MKLLTMFLIAILIIQAFVVEVSSSTDAEEGDEGNLEELMNKHRPLEELMNKHRPRTIHCNYACARRCSKSSRKNVCHRACKSCCTTCHCVPPGTYGNKGLCPCYAKLDTWK